MKKGLKATFMVALMLLTVLSSIVSVNATPIKEETTSSSKGYFIEITKIVPYYRTTPYINKTLLCFTVEITNTGDESTNGDMIGFSAKAYRYGKVVFSYNGQSNSVLNPDESYLNINGGDGLQFVNILFPTIFRLEFYSIPSNDYATGIYLIWGGFILEPQYVKIFTTVPSTIPSSIDYPFLERFPMLNLLLQRLRI